MDVFSWYFCLFKQYKLLIFPFLFTFVQVKRFATILLLFLFVTYGTELYQLYKLPFLVQHFIKHKHEDKNLSLIQFLAIHYTHGDVNDKDMQEDMKLPFKTCCHSSVLTINAVVPQTNTTISIKEIYCLKNEFVECNTQYNPSVLASPIWQPPKNV